MFWSEFCSRCDLTLLIIVVIFDRLFRCFKGLRFVDAFLVLKIILCRDAFLLFDENYHFLD